jgi:hypothetical protein
VDLDARSVELVLQRDVAELAEGLVDGVRRLREHWLKRTHDLDGKHGERAFATFQRGPGDRRQASGHHRRAAHDVRADAGGLREGFDEDALERAVAQLAVQQSAQEGLFLACGAREELSETRGALTRDPRPCTRASTSNASSTSRTVSAAVPAGSASDAAEMAACPMLIEPCRGAPDRNATTASTSGGPAACRTAASRAIFSRRRLVAATASAASTSAMSCTDQS